MNHSIEFRLPIVADVEVSGKARGPGGVEQLLIKKGDHLQVEIKPCVVESDEGFLEVADLLMKDGSVAPAR